MQLKSKETRELVLELQTLVRQERELTTRILHYLEEVDRRKFYLEQGCSTLFDWCTRVLGYSTGAAHRRIQSMRLLKALPELETKIESGELSLSVAARAQSFFYQEEKKGVLPKEAKKQIVDSLLGLSTRDCEKKLAELSPPPENPGTRVEFTASPELLAKLEELQARFSHQNPEKDLGCLIETLADLALKEPTRKFPAPEIEMPRTRHIPNALKREVWRRDQGRCTYKDKASGHVCGSRHRLQYDHLLAYALGGGHTLENLTLRCANHNRWRTRELGSATAA